MSLFSRNEARKEPRGSRMSTADMAAAMSEAQPTRPMADEPVEAAPAHTELWREERHRADTSPAAEGRAAVLDAEVEDAVVIPERPAAAKPQARPMDPAAERLAALFGADVAKDLRTRWDATQISFVDDPRRAVQQADELVAEVMQTLAQSFADERRELEAQMKSESASTENLRVALQRYRSFFQRLLTL